MATIADAVTEVRNALAQDATLALLSAPASPPDVLNLPAIVAYAKSGGGHQATFEGDWEIVHTIAVEVHVARQSQGLANAYAALMTYLPLVTGRLSRTYTATRFAGTVVLAGGGRGGGEPIRYKVEQDSWADTATLVLAVEMDVLVEEA